MTKMKKKSVKSQQLKTKAKKPLIGFIGQGFIGKNYADDFEKRGFEVVRYAIEEPYRQNKERIIECEIVFIAVPTPSTPKGFDDSIIRSAVKLVGKGKVAVIKSTMLPGTTLKLQENHSDIFVFHSPEFLREKTAAYDASHPDRNIIGIAVDNVASHASAKKVLSVLPKAPFEAIISSTEAELVKYGGNNYFYFKVVYINMLFDLADKFGCRWEVIRDAMTADPRIGMSHMEPVHNSGHVKDDQKGGRGAGGHCFIKDFAAFSDLYRQVVGDRYGLEVLKSLRDKNVDLLIKSGKDPDLLYGVYGDAFLKKFENNQ